MTPEQARAQYRTAWTAYLLTREPLAIEGLERLMDEAQPFIARCPNDPAWKEFAASLPGYKDFWARLKADGLDEMRARAKE